MLCRCLEGGVGILHLAEGKLVRDQLLGLDAAGGEQFQQHRGGDGVDEPGGQGDVVAPQLLDLQAAALAVDADVGDGAAGGDEVLGHLEGDGEADGLDDGVAARVAGQAHDGLLGRRLAAVDRVVRPELLGHAQPVGILVDDDEQAGRVQLGRHQGRQPDGARAHDGHRRPGLHLAVQHAALEPRGQDVGQHDEALLVHARRHVVQPAVRQRDPHVLGLRPVDRVAQDPAALDAVAVHAPPTVVARRTARDAVDEYVVAFLEPRHRGPCLMDHADPCHALLVNGDDSVEGVPLAFVS